MSVSRVVRRDGHRYLVWWKDERGRTRNKTFRRKADADAFDSKIKLAKSAGDLAEITAGRETLAEFVSEWRTLYARQNLTPKTLLDYERYLANDILPALGHIQLRKVTPIVVQRFAAALGDANRGASVRRKILSLLQGIMERAVEWQRIRLNPVKVVKKPTAPRSLMPVPIAPSGIEAIRRNMSMRDAVLVSVLAYAGLRPGEALALTWSDIDKRTLRITKSISLGEQKGTKTGKSRVVPVRQALAVDLNKWKLKSGSPAGDQLVFPGHDGGPWKDHEYRNWRRRQFHDAVVAGGVTCRRPYELRHSYASLRFAEQVNPVVIAAETGDTLETLLRTYVHVIAELAGSSVWDGDQLISDARSGHIPVTWKPGMGQKVASSKAENPA
ncbi:MAG: tyrosine-type recombinase/integrase [Actinobacteria bacterium]|uniref:Unannotated protein n=1 Tax=freshwater metagenome TaxID=449393 RepID=A0A6J5ZZS9_9ZZZZ|nr:tyrosine-type recombinase/integrase [Actinomycetota bacterium]